MSGRRLHVLIGVDGSSESAGALDAALRLFEAAIGEVTIAIALDYDGDLTDVPLFEQERATSILHAGQEAARNLGYEPSTAILVGRPATALVRHARQHGCDVIIVGPRGHGASHLLFGSVASHLASAGAVPVAILPGVPAKVAA